MKSKLFVAAAALTLCSAASFAQDLATTIDLTKNGNNWTGGFSLTHTIAGAFNDIITFKPNITGKANAGLFTVGFTPEANINFTSARLYTDANPTGVPLFLSSLGGVIEGGASLPTLFTGPFKLAVSGFSGNAATYTGTLNVSVSPVPEPETYAMFGAGLGLLAFLTRRRAKKDRAEKNITMSVLTA